MYIVSSVMFCCFTLCSEFSDVLLFHSGAGPPSAPGKPHIVQAGPEYINVGWSVPNANGAEVTCYKLEKDDIDGVSLTIASVTAGSIKIRR